MALGLVGLLVIEIAVEYKLILKFDHDGTGLQPDNSELYRSSFYF